MESNTSEHSGRRNGKVKLYNEVKGFGFLSSEEGDIFFHVSEIADGSEPPDLNSIYYGSSRFCVG